MVIYGKRAIFVAVNFVLTGSHHNNDMTMAAMDILCAKTAALSGTEYMTRHHKLLADEIGHASYYSQSCSSLRSAHILARNNVWALKIYHGMGTAHQRWDTASLVLTARDMALLATFLQVLVKESAPNQAVQFLAQTNDITAHEELSKQMDDPLEWTQLDEGVVVAYMVPPDDHQD